jgi:ribosomal protein S25
MNARDKAIVEDIQRFRVLSRDLIADLHFQNVKNKVTAANYVLKRLRRDKYISCSDDRRQYIYTFQQKERLRRIQLRFHIF